MATAVTEFSQSGPAMAGEACSGKAASSKQGDGLRQYYLQHIHDLQLQVRQKTHNLNRLEAQRNDLNSRGFPSRNPNFDAMILRRLSVL